jgi:YidC/Oxa1 family membrane protein insertase
MQNIFYTIIIFPIEQIIELCYVFIFRITKSPGLSIIGLSMAVSTLILPIYLMAEKQQKAERDKQKQMKGEIDNIKAVFKGDKRYMMISTLYRQHNYHPLYALRNSIDFFLQIPFFIAAYHFLHNLELLNGQAFKFISDLGAPDKLLGNINLLPIIMTIINCVSASIYTKELQIKDKVQLYGIALIFLVLLYNSPSALVLYWTFNNIYNLFKNIILKQRNKERIIYIILCAFLATLSVYVLFFHHGIIYKRIIITLLAMIIMLFPFWKNTANNIWKKYVLKNTALGNMNLIFTFSIAGIFLLIGVIIPSTLIASSVEEFSFIEPFSSPLPFIGITILQSAGILIWVICVYFLFTRQVRLIMALLLTAILGIFMVNVFFYNMNYGFLTPDLNFSNFHTIKRIEKIINILVLLFTAGFLIFLLIKKKVIALALQSIIIISLLSYGIINIFKINNNFTKISSGEDVSTDNFDIFKKYYTFSKNGKNLLLIMVDYGVSGYIPFIFEEKPELLNSYSGFIYYPNTISFGTHTNHGLSGIFGGYYYTPLEIHNRSGKSWYEEYCESMQVLPLITAKSGYNVTINNQFWMDYSLYNKYNNITAESTRYNFMNQYLYQFKNDILFKDFNKILFFTLLRFSFFKVSPYVLQNFIYDHGNYLLLNNFFLDSSYSKPTIACYAQLHYLPDITSISEENENYFTIFLSELVSYYAFMELPDYKPSDNHGFRGSGPLAEEKKFHVMMSTFFLLAKWFDFLKENDVYNNTRIIIVSDHGYNQIQNPFDDINNLPDERTLTGFNAILMVKDFNSEFELKSDTSFMTNADVPHIMTEGMFQTLVNPFTSEELLIDKNNGVTITTNDIWEPEIFNKARIKPNEWLHVKDNIFEPNNWSKVTIK